MWWELCLRILIRVRGNKINVDYVKIERAEENKEKKEKTEKKEKKENKRKKYWKDKIHRWNWGEAHARGLPTYALSGIGVILIEFAVHCSRSLVLFDLQMEMPLKEQEVQVAQWKPQVPPPDWAREIADQLSDDPPMGLTHDKDHPFPSYTVSHS